MEEIIHEIKEGSDLASEGGDSVAAVSDEHKRVMKAVQDGLLQIHGIAPNTKQHGIFRIMGENCNRLHNRIGGNEKITR